MQNCMCGLFFKDAILGKVSIYTSESTVSVCTICQSFCWAAKMSLEKVFVFWYQAINDKSLAHKQDT